MSRTEDDNGFAEWGGYMVAKVKKLGEQFSAASVAYRKDNLFEGISIFVNGLTNPTANELKMLMMQHGGIFHDYECNSTTYVIADNLPHVKMRKLRLDVNKIVRARWIVDCIKEKRILDTSAYLLLTNRKKSQPGLNFMAINKKSLNQIPYEIDSKPTNALCDKKASAEHWIENEKSKSDQSIAQPTCNATNLKECLTKLCQDLPLQSSFIKKDETQSNKKSFKHENTLTSNTNIEARKRTISYEETHDLQKMKALKLSLPEATKNLPDTSITRSRTRSNSNIFVDNLHDRDNIALQRRRSSQYDDSLNCETMNNIQIKNTVLGLQHLSTQISTEKSTKISEAPLNIACIQLKDITVDEAIGNKDTTAQSFHAIKNVNNISKAQAINEDNHKKNAPQPPKEEVKSISKQTLQTALTAKDPKFLDEFYSNSRLHLISTLSTTFKEYINNLRSSHDSKLGFPARILMKENFKDRGIASHFDDKMAKACIMHIDMDCFFVSVSLTKYPHLRGLPIAITHSKGGKGATQVPQHPQSDRQAEMEMFLKRFDDELHDNIRSDKVRNGFEAKMSLSEIASCSYEARAKGIRNGMFMGQAMKLCPELKAVPYDFKSYTEVAFKLYEIVSKYTLNIEAVSCDEMYVDLSDILTELQVSPMVFVTALREEVRKATGCPCSAGIGANKLQARLATKKAKPDGQYLISNNDIMSLMTPMLVEDLPGIGSNNAYTLKKANLLTCGDIQKFSLERIQMLMGKKLGETLYDNCRGIDKRPLQYEQIRKSVSAEVNYGIRFKTYDECTTFLQSLCEEAHKRLQDIKRKTKTINLKVMIRAPDAPMETSKFLGHGACISKSKSLTFPEYTDDIKQIISHAKQLMKTMGFEPQDLRGVGVTLTKLNESNNVPQSKNSTLSNMFKKLVENQAVKQKKVDIPAVPKMLSETLNNHLADGSTTPKNVANESKTDTDNNEDIFDLSANPDCNIFMQNKCQDFFLEWVTGCESPDNFDINFITRCARETIEKDDLENLYEGMLYLCRLINYKRGTTEYCCWHLGYRKIEAVIQLNMQNKKNMNLKFGDQLKCKACQL